MSLVVFPDLCHQERADIDLERYVDQLLAKHTPIRCMHWTEEILTRTIVRVHDWMLRVIRQADIQREDPIASLRRAKRPVAPAEERCVLDAVLEDMVRVTCRELKYRGMNRVRRANARFEEGYPPPPAHPRMQPYHPISRKHVVRFKRPEPPSNGN